MGRAHCEAIVKLHVATLQCSLLALKRRRLHPRFRLKRRRPSFSARRGERPCTMEILKTGPQIRHDAKRESEIRPRLIQMMGRRKI